MTCKKCLNNKCKIKDTKMNTRECKKCNNKQFYTRRSNHIPIAFVCSICGEEIKIEKETKYKNEYSKKDLDIIKEAE